MNPSTRNKLIGAAILVGVIILIRAYGPTDFFSLENIKQNRGVLQNYVSQHYVLATLAYFILYFCITAFSIPVAAPLTIAGGFFFGTIPAACLTVSGATLGALALFLIVRFLIGEFIQERYATRLVWLNSQLAEHGSNYLLSLRLLAVVPFFMINLVAGLTSITLWTFAWTTTIGITPGSLVFAFAGRQLGNISSARDVFSLPVLIAFGLLALLSLLPVFIKKFLNRKETPREIP